MDLSRVNNSLDTHRRPFPPTIVVERALQKVLSIIRLKKINYYSWELVTTILCTITVSILLNGADTRLGKVIRFKLFHITKRSLDRV